MHVIRRIRLHQAIHPIYEVALLQPMTTTYQTWQFKLACVASHHIPYHRQRVAAKARFRKRVGHNDRGVKSNGDKLEEELSEVRLEMTRCVAWLGTCTYFL